MMTAPGLKQPHHDRAVGIGLVFIATVAWSLSGVFTRLLTTDIWTAIAWRSFFGGLFLLVPYLVLRYRQPAKPRLRIGLPGLILIASQIACQAATVAGLTYTTVANVTVIYATAPFIAAALAWWLMGERIERRTVTAGAACLTGTVVIVFGSLGEGHLLGDAMALVMTATFAVIIVLPRVYRDLSTVPSTIISAFATTLIFAPFGSVGSLDAWNWSVLAAFGLTNFSIALFLFVAGARRIRSAEAALIGILEIVFAPFWVWLLFSEAPGWPAIMGGLIILVAVVWHTALDRIETKKLAAA